MKKRIMKIILVIISILRVVGFVGYEGYSISKKERERQIELAEATRAEINLKLDMVKIAVQTNDAELYAKNLDEIQAGANRIWSLFLLREQQKEYLLRLSEYVEILKSKKDFLAEMQSLKETVKNIKSVLQEQYGNKDNISRDKVKEAKAKIAELKFDISQYSVEKIKRIVNAVNGVLDSVIDKVGTLADCIDTCYKNRINEVNDELADAFKNFTNKVADLNKDFERELGLTEMEKLKAYEINYDGNIIKEENEEV